MRFYIGDLVYIKKKLPSYMRNFKKGLYAIITSESEDQYMTNIAGWYPENTLRLIKRNSNIKLFNKFKRKDK